MKRYCRACKRFFDIPLKDYKNIRHCPYCRHIYSQTNEFEDKTINNLYDELKSKEQLVEETNNPTSVVLWKPSFRFILNALNEYYENPERDENK